MNATLTANTASIRPTFRGMVQGELFKLLRQRAVIITAIVVAAVFVVYTLRLALYLNFAYNVQQQGDGGLTISDASITYSLSQLLLTDLRGLIGIFIMVVTVSAIALEYQQGTIRVLLARGLGRLRLLGAKLTAVGLISLGMLVVLVVLSGIMAFVDTSLSSGGAGVLGQSPPYFWSDAFTTLGTVLVSMFGTILLAATFAVLGRSMAFGLGFTLPYFFVESLVGTILNVVALATKNDLWSKIPTYFFGNAISALTTTLVPDRGLGILGLLSRGSSALGPSVDATHAIAVTLVYLVILAGITTYLTWKRDVLQ